MKPTVSVTMTVCPSPRPHAPAGGIQCGEELVLHSRHLLTHQGVQEGGLAGVGVAHHGHRGDEPAVPCSRRRLPTLAHRLHPLLHLLDAQADDAAVRLQLLLPGAPRSDTTTRAGEVGPQTREPWQLVLQLGQLHLQPPLCRLSPLGEDVQDQAAAVQHLHVQQVLEGALLPG